jgi:excisionase family DNA binding protein
LAAGVRAQGESLVFDDEMLTIEDVAAYLKLKPQTIYKWAQTGKIPGAKFGKEWRFRRSAIEQWIDRQISSQSGAPQPADVNREGDGGGDPAAGGAGRVKQPARGSEKVAPPRPRSGNTVAIASPRRSAAIFRAALNSAATLPSSDVADSICARIRPRS